MDIPSRVARMMSSFALVIAAPIRVSPSSRVQATMPLRRERENSSSAVFLMIPCLVASAMKLFSPHSRIG